MTVHRHPAPLLALWHALAVIRPDSDPTPETDADPQPSPNIEVRRPFVPPQRKDRAWRRGEYRKWPGGQP